MLRFIWKTLKDRDHKPADDAAAIEERTSIAASVLLLEAAQADHECSDKELEHVIETLRADFNLSRKHAEDLIEVAHHEKDRAVDLFEFTNHINNTFSKNEKKAVLEAVWRIIFIDGHLEKHEDHFVRKLTHLLRFTHKDMIDAKLKAREQLQ
jgi:uncharacterized tellurite resistance protein B-like protein